MWLIRAHLLIRKCAKVTDEKLSFVSNEKSKSNDHQIWESIGYPGKKRRYRNILFIPYRRQPDTNENRSVPYCPLDSLQPSHYYIFFYDYGFMVSLFIRHFFVYFSCFCQSSEFAFFCCAGDCACCIVALHQRQEYGICHECNNNRKHIRVMCTLVHCTLYIDGL